MKRRILLNAAAMTLVLSAGLSAAQDMPPLEQKDSDRVGFA